MTQLTFGTVAPTSRRAVAYIIDALIAAGLGVVLSIILVIVATMAGTEGMLAVLAIGAVLIWLLMLGWFVVYTLMQSGRGSIGMRAQGLRIAREADGSSLGFGRTLLRNVIFGLAASIFIGYFTPLFDGSGRFQGWHDKVAKSLMLDARTSPIAAGAPSTQPMQIPPRPQPPLPVAGAPQGAPNPLSPQPLFPQAGPPNLATQQAASPQQAPAQQSSAPPIPGLPAAQTGAAGFAAPVPAAPRVPAQTPAPESASLPVAKPTAANDDPLIAFVPGITQDAPPVRNTPEPPAVIAPAPESDSSIPEQTQLRGEVIATPAPVLPESSDLEDTRISIPGHRLIFTWDDGTRVTVSQRTIFGRNPAPEQGAVIVPVRDETLSLSKTHFEAAAEASGGWITDRNSTNGTAIVRDGHRIICTPGEQVRVRLGDAIEIGDRIVTIGGYA